MSIESIEFNMENENNRHKIAMDNFERSIHNEKNRHEQAIKSLIQQKKNALKQKQVKEYFCNLSIMQINQAFVNFLQD